MSWFNSILSYLSDISDWFYDAYLTVNGWVSPFWHLASPLYSIYRAFYYLNYYFGQFSEWVFLATAKLSQILSIDVIRTYFGEYFQAAFNAWQWVQSAPAQIFSQVSYWWNSIQYDVLAWIENAKQWALAQINNLAGALAEVQTWWNSFKANIPSLNAILSWFTNWWGNVLSHLNSWWNERLGDIEDLLLSWTLELAPFWEGWQEIRDDVYTFFASPFDWIFSHFEDWFWGKE